MNQRPWIELEIIIKKDGWPSKAAFAEATGLRSQGHLSDLLSGRRNPTAAYIAKVAAVTGYAKSQIEKRASEEDVERFSRDAA
jgi:transcriptional regulator with XRE-family HTH domain